MEWIYNNRDVENIDKSYYGFVYVVTYSDGKMYIGKKNLRSCVTLPALKNGTVRDGAKRISKRVPMTRAELAQRTNIQLKNKVSSKIEEFDIVCKESKWRNYEGSCKDVGDRTLVRKEILQFCYDSINLTYQEVKFLCQFNCIVDDNYLNANILNKFFRGKVR